MFQREHSNGRSRYHCIRAAAASERRVLPLDEVADVSVSHRVLPAPARRSRSGLAVGWETEQRHGLCRVQYSRWWKMLAVAGRRESGQRRVMADDRRHGMTSVMMCSSGWCWVWVPWLAWFGRCLVSEGGAGGQFSLPTGGEAHVCLAQTASSSSPVSTSHQTQPVADKTHLAPSLVLLVC